MSGIVINERTKSWLYPVIFGNIGGKTRIRIIRMLYKKALSTNNIAKELGMSYKGVQYQIKHLEKTEILKHVGDTYGVLYYLTDKMEENYSIFENLVDITPCLKQNSM